MRKTLQFFLFDWLRAETLRARPRFSDHTRETFESVLDTCERIASEKFAPFNRRVDVDEPRMVDGSVVLPECAYETARAYVESGMLAAAQDYDLGGMQLPATVELAGNAFFSKAGIGLGGGTLLTVGNANLLMTHGTQMQREVFARNEFAGRWFGTMCLSEPQAGSSLSDILTRAVPDGRDFESEPLGPRYRLYGNKMWITNGEHEITENIVHLVLAKIQGPDGRLPPGARGVSLFIVPKKLVNTEGELTGERNDVALAGLNHKLGYRGFPNTLLNFGEGKYLVRGSAGAIGYLVGKPGHGLQCMFHMMNEARINVGAGAVAIGMAGFEASLEYARNRSQGRKPGPAGKDPAAPPVRIIEHADVRRMLLAQKAYAEGGLALVLYCAKLVDDKATSDPEEAREAAALLEILTPIAKSWPSEWCLEANSLAIQVHGGYGYTRDYPVEQLWRDNRLNMIHEGTHGIQALDLLGRKVRMDGGAALAVLAGRIAGTVDRALSVPQFAARARELADAMSAVRNAVDEAWKAVDPELALANATPFMQAFGHTVIAWLWLDAGLAAHAAMESDGSSIGKDHLSGKLHCVNYFFDYELPKTSGWLRPVATRSAACFAMKDESFTP
jgi:butyryl-CoA dehydrogenase